MFIVLTDKVNASNHLKSISLSNQKCEVQPTLNNLNPRKYSQEVHYYPFAVKLDRCVKVVILLMTYLIQAFVPNKTEDSNIPALIWLQEKWIKIFNKRHIMQM